MSVRLEHGDMREVLKSLAREGVQVDSCVCDPPYHLDSIVKRFGKGGAGATSDEPTGVFKRASAGFMGQTWDGGDIAFDPETWKLVHEVMKPGAWLAAFGAPRNFGFMQTAIAAAGFEVMDCVLNLVDPGSHVATFMDSLNEEQLSAFVRCFDDTTAGGMLAWVFGTGFPKSKNVSKLIDRALGIEPTVIGHYRTRDIRNGQGEARNGNMLAAERGAPSYIEQPITQPTTDEAWQWFGWGTAIKPAFEPIILARKKLDGTIAENAMRHGTGVLNIDGCRIENADAVPGGGRDGQVSAGVKTDDPKAGLRLTAGPRGGDALGRFPADVTHDGSPAVEALFPQSAGQLRAVRPEDADKTGRGIYNAFAQNSTSEPRGDEGSAARFFWSPKADRDERAGSGHPTVKPLELMRWLVRLVTRRGGTTLDCFAGSGSTGEAALYEGRNAILIEREATYIEDIKRRLAMVEMGPAERARTMHEADKKRGRVKDDALPLFGED